MRGYEFDIKGFVVAMGGPTACWRALVTLGFDLEQRTVNKWLERGNLDITYIVNLLAYQALNDGPVDINRFIVPAREGPRMVRRQKSFPRQPLPGEEP